MQTPSCNEILSVRLSVCLSVCPSVKRVYCDKTEEKSVQICIPCERSFCLVLWEEEWLVGATPSIRNFGSTGPRLSEIADFEPIIARSASTVPPSEKSSINTNRKSPTRFPTSLRWSLYVAHKSPKGGLKNAKRQFFLYNRTSLEESLLQSFFLCEYCQRKSCRAFIGLTIHANIIVGGRPLQPEILGQSDRVWAKSPIFDLFSFVAPKQYDLAKKVQLTLIGSPLGAL